MGNVNGVASRIVVCALNNAGTIKLAFINLSGGINLDETQLITTVAIGGGSTAANVFYSDAVYTGVAYRVVGLIDSTQATATNWASALTNVLGGGGNVAVSMGSLGFGQTWQLVTRTAGVTYRNTTGKPLSFIRRIAAASIANFASTITVDTSPAMTFMAGNAISSGEGAGSGVIPASASYVFADVNAAAATTWELR
jgi:hypothetical protein